jgi:HEAT repeat protein
MTPFYAPRFLKAGFLLFVVAVFACYTTQAQTSSLQQFFQALVGHYDAASLPKLDDLMKVTNQIEGARPAEITGALPAIFVALAHQDDTVKAYAATALFAVARRSDSTALLRSRVDVIGHDLLTATKPETRAGEIIILGSLKPSPPPEVVPIFLTFLKRTDAEAQAQGSAVIFELVHIAPENPEVIAAVQEFLSGSLDSKSRIDVLNALGDPRVKDARIIAMMIRALDDPDQGVRFTAAQALAGMGRSALQQAESTLQRLADDPKQPADVRAAAKEALQRIHPK